MIFREHYIKPVREFYDSDLIYFTAPLGKFSDL